jgi:hypothetical protein
MARQQGCGCTDVCVNEPLFLCCIERAQRFPSSLREEIIAAELKLRHLHCTMNRSHEAVSCWAICFSSEQQRPKLLLLLSPQQLTLVLCLLVCASRYKFNMPADEYLVLQSALSPVVDDGPEVIWEDA